MSLLRKSGEGCLPNLIIIGAQKSGTTSLHRYLNFHPEIKMTSEKELDFFINKPGWRTNWHKGLDWYKNRFRGEAKIRGESSPNYTTYPGNKGIPERMHSVIPDAKLIYVLRDPIERIISNYVHNCWMGREKRTISEALKNVTDENMYISRSKYYLQLKQFLDYFPLSQILIITHDDLYAERSASLKKIFRFLGIDDSFKTDNFRTLYNRSSLMREKNSLGVILSRTPVQKAIERLPQYLRWKTEWLIYYPFSRKIERPELDDDLKNVLIDHLREDINNLRELTGLKLENWCL